MTNSNKKKTTPKKTRIVNNTSGNQSDMKRTSQISSNNKMSKQEKPGHDLAANRKYTAPVKSDKDKIKPEENSVTKTNKPGSANNTMAKTSLKSGAAKTKSAETSIASPAKRKTTLNEKSVSQKAKPNTSIKTKDPANTIQSKKQSAKDLFSKQEKDVPDLNTSTVYPVHPNRIWPD